MVSRTLLSSLPTPTTSTTRLNTRETAASSVNRILPFGRAALLVAISYYVGTRIGFAWTPAGQTNSTFWPANAILLAGLLLTPRKAWWMLFLAVLPAHMLAQLQSGVPVGTALSWFVTNGSEAIIGAYCITRFTDSQKRFVTVRGVLIFVVFGVLFAPLATSFLDAGAVVLTGLGRHYWPLVMERFWTNALAELTIVPTIVLAGARGISWIRRTGRARLCEAVLLAIGIALVAFLVFGFEEWSSVSTPALLYVPLPFLLWAAARFGLGGLSLSLLSLALISTWYTMHGQLPFPQASMQHNILSLQILFCAVAVPLMFLSAVMAEARRTQESLRMMSGTLLKAQEEERRRIGRELHDDINQRLAMVAIELEQVQDDHPEVRSRLQEIRQQTSEISNDVQALSHDLHSSKLEYLGVVRGIKSWCEDFAERQRMEFDFNSDVSSVLPFELGTCLLRVLQEAVQNTVKHSGVKRIEVQLTQQSGEVHLIVRDSGTGFDVEAAMQRKGLGLTSMRERVRLVNGTIAIDSKPMSGTRIHVRVPLESEHDN
jgi:signal transduction histidine kinase